MVRFMAWYLPDGRVQIFGSGRMPSIENWGLYQLDDIAGELLARQIGESAARSIPELANSSRDALMRDGRFLMTPGELILRAETERLIG